MLGSSLEWNGMEWSASHGPVKGQKSDGITRFAKECKLVQATSELQSSCIGVVVSPLFALRLASVRPITSRAGLARKLSGTRSQPPRTPPWP
jgi:hypothetical protein